jgi:hypothetical protein
MPDIAGFPYYEITFTADGALSSDGGLVAAAGGGGITNVFMFSHGWNCSESSARSLYQDMFAMIAGMLGADLGTSAAVGIFWPSLLFPEDDPSQPDTPSSGAQLARALTPAFPGQATNLAAMGSLLDTRPQDPTQLETFHKLASGLVTTAPLAPEDSGPQAMIDGSTSAVLGYAASMAKSPADDGQGLPNPFTTLWSGARELLRTMSYYEMKNRAGVIGQKGLGPLLASLAAAHAPVRVHLFGHSFGARLVSYALNGLPDTAVGAANPVKSLSLIQGAFSHFTFASATTCQAVPAGALAGFLNRVDGPLLSTFTAADRALGWWYPAISLLARQDSQSLNDVLYQFGAMGHDGYQQLPPATTVNLLDKGNPYGFAKGSLYQLDSNNVIKADQSAFSGAHSDIRHPEVAWAVVSAAATV